MSWVLTRAGVEFSLVNPTPDMVNIYDIAFSLARIRRFNGHTLENCSVALHSIIVCKFLEEMGYDKNMQRWGLLHDAHEAYLGDISSPVKATIKEGKLDALAGGIDAAIYNRFDINTSTAINWIRYADLCALNYERINFMPESSTEWPTLKDIPEIKIHSEIKRYYEVQNPIQHESLFLDKCNFLGIS